MLVRSRKLSLLKLMEASLQVEKTDLWSCRMSDELGRADRGLEESDIRFGDRKERVRVMSDLYEKIPDCRVALKLKVLAQIREETKGIEFVVEHHHAVSSTIDAAS